MRRPVPFEFTSNGIMLTVRLTPRSALDRLEGQEILADDTPVLKARVRAVPEDNKANQALIKLVAKNLSQPRATLTLAAGHKSRIKKILIQGDTKEIAAKIEVILKT